MALGLIQAGERITAALLNSIAPQAVVKPADQSVTSSTVQVNDTALVVPVTGGATYLFSCYLDYEGNNAPGDINWSWAVPAAATLRYVTLGRTLAGAATPPVTSGAGTNVIGGANGSGNPIGAFMSGSLLMASASGTLQLQWAQNTSSATSTIVHAQSYVALWRIS